jgi:hypothetical protein
MDFDGAKINNSKQMGHMQRVISQMGQILRVDSPHHEETD